MIGEWNYGWERHWSGALATAHALGAFGREGVDFAFYWTVPRHAHAVAFRAFRDYDGEGARFPATSIPAQGDEQLLVFAARDEGRVVAILINEDPSTARDLSLRAQGCGGAARAFVWSGGEALAPAPAARRGPAVTLRLPPASLGVVELREPGVP